MQIARTDIQLATNPLLGINYTGIGIYTDREDNITSSIRTWTQIPARTMLVRGHRLGHTYEAILVLNLVAQFSAAIDHEFRTLPIAGPLGVIHVAGRSEDDNAKSGGDLPDRVAPRGS